MTRRDFAMPLSRLKLLLILLLLLAPCGCGQSVHGIGPVSPVSRHEDGADSLRTSLSPQQYRNLSRVSLFDAYPPPGLGRMSAHFDHLADLRYGHIPDTTRYLVFGTTDDAQGQLWLADAAAESVEQLALFENCHTGIQDWSPDRTMVALIAMDDDSQARLRAYIVSIEDLSITELGSSIRPVQGPVFPDWSHDSQGFFLSAPVRPKDLKNPANEIWQWHRGEESLNKVYAEPSDRKDGGHNEPIRQVVASPDGEYLAFGRSLSRDFQTGISIVRLSDSQIFQATWEDSDRYIHQPLAWSQDGRYLFFSRGYADDSRPWRLDLTEFLQD